jgi:Na+/melibiose symporter-like transporter
MTFWSENKTKILGAAASVVGYISAGIAAGMFMGLLEPTTVQWLGIGCGAAIAVLGHFTSAVGFSNTTKERVAQSQATVEVAKAHQAEAMVEAINTPAPGGQGP